MKPLVAFDGEVRSMCRSHGFLWHQEWFSKNGCRSPVAPNTVPSVRRNIVLAVIRGLFISFRPLARQPT